MDIPPTVSHSFALSKRSPGERDFSSSRLHDVPTAALLIEGRSFEEECSLLRHDWSISPTAALLIEGRPPSGEESSLLRHDWSISPTAALPIEGRSFGEERERERESHLRRAMRL